MNVYFHMSYWSQEVHSYLKCILILFHFFKTYCSLVILFHKIKKPPTCTLCFLHTKKTNSTELFSLCLVTYPPSGCDDMLVFPLYVPALLHLPLPLLFSWPSISLHIEVIIHVQVEMHVFCEAFSDFCICKCIFLPLSFYCSISQDPLRKTIHASGFTRDNLIKFV